MVQEDGAEGGTGPSLFKTASLELLRTLAPTTRVVEVRINQREIEMKNKSIPWFLNNFML